MGVNRAISPRVSDPATRRPAAEAPPHDPFDLPPEPTAARRGPGFLAGFLVASVLWGGAGAVYFGGFLADEPLVVEGPEAPAEVEAPAEEDPPPRQRRRRRRRGARRAAGRPVPQGFATTGDDLGENDPRYIDGAGAGGEQQLRSSQIEQVIDGQFGAIRRCLILVPGDAPATGTLTFGLRITGTGRVDRVNLAGPAAVTRGEPGDCLRGVGRRLSFPSFDGPDMIVRYPITLE